MLGLAFIGGEAPEPAICRLLAQDAGIVAAADSGLQAAENSNVRPDWIIGDMDSLDDPQRLEKYPAERIRRFPQDKDKTDTEMVLDLLWEKGCDELCIAGGGGGRLDHLLAIRSLFEREKHPRRWVTRAEDVRCLDAAYSFLEELSLPADALVSVFPLGAGPWEAESRGLKWPLKGVSWDRGSFGISNRTTEGQFSIQVIQGRFMLIVPIV
jgi:thiamine pyrophosphokinase